MLFGIVIKILLLLFYAITAESGKFEDEITYLPGLTFNPSFKQYSGFLQTKSQNNLHYWLVESQNNPSTDPILLWLNGGPGCSSLGGFFTENGPFRVDQDGETLFENVYSWNKAANVLYLESPRLVGYSYRNSSAPPDNIWSDAKTAEDNADALAVFFERFPEYQGRPFFVTGESYAGVYLPTLTNLLISRIMAGNLTNVNLAGMAIGNGILSEVDQTNSVIDIFYWRGMLGKGQFDSLKQCCMNMTGPLAYCNFSSYIDWSTFGPKPFNTTLENDCAYKIATFSYGGDINDPYNTYQDCYMDTESTLSTKYLKLMKFRNPTKSKRSYNVVQRMQERFFDSTVERKFIDQGALINIGSTDAQYGFPCWMDDMTHNYLNLPAVRSALHIPENLPQWEDCNNVVFRSYVRQNLNTAPVFQSIFNSGFPLHMLIYNGDVDTVCNFLGDEWFINRFVEKNYFTSLANRSPWTFEEKPFYLPQLAGYLKTYIYEEMTIDLLTVKGAGHFVPLDRGGPSLQMITNFIQKKNYSSIMPWNTVRKDLFPEYRTTYVPYTRKEAARIWYQPGLTYQINFKQYSGYLNAVPGNHLHYWLVESQRNPEKDPLVLWLNGGPGCSSLGGFFSENGPFRVNPDSKTLYENIYSWNKIANVLYLESPRNIGFSYQNMSVNRDPSYNDLKTARDSFLALMDFLSVFPEYYGRDFYITGESYGGIYIPTLTNYTVHQILAGNAPGLNLVGIAIGNGELSMKEQLNSIMSMLFYRGIYGIDIYHQLMMCCNNTNEPAAYCDFSKNIYFDHTGSANPLNSTSECDNLIVQYGNQYIWENQDIQDVYNIYEDGYRQPNQPNAASYSRTASMLRKLSIEMGVSTESTRYADRRWKINYKSTDGKANFYWYQQTATPNYLNLPDVRAALHIPPFVQQWADCNDDVNANYIQQHNDTSPVFQDFINTKRPLKILIYNGDADMACEFLGDEWFVEKLAKHYNMNVARARTQWKFETQRAGYWKQFRSPVGSLDLVTVKGAGHFVPLDRPGPSLQMLNSFIESSDYSTPLNIPTALSNLTKQYLIDEKIAMSANQTLRIKRSNIDGLSQANGSTDIITELTGLNFKPTFQQYSGLLDVSANYQLHYWLFEAENSSEKPLILWLGDGPTCSAIFDIVNNIGPYRLSANGKELFENPYSWTQFANLLFLEAMPGAGFSPKASQNFNDTYVINSLTAAVKTFFELYPNLQKNYFYIFGKGYGAIYAISVALQIKKMTIPTNIQGLGLGNALLNYSAIINNMPNELYFSALLGKSEWDQLIKCCMLANGAYDNHCNYAKYVTVGDDGIIRPIESVDPLMKECGKLVADYAYEGMLSRMNPSGNMYRSCYDGIAPAISSRSGSRVKRQAYHLDGLPLTDIEPFVNQAALINYLSTDAFASYPCYMDYASTIYFDTESVRNNLHIPQSSPIWQKCAKGVNYKRELFDMTPNLQELFKMIRDEFQVLVFDGDSHLENNFLANEFFFEMFAARNHYTKTTREAWTYQESNKYLPQYAGFTRLISSYPYSYIYIHTTTIKGAGYYVALDRPAPTYQLVYNFLHGHSYNNTVPVESTQPLLPEYKPKPSEPVSRKTADQIFDLPGLTFNITFDQYSGYLHGVNGSYLHYWYVESQNQPASDPIIVWFSGGPGCSSLGALLAENGPFRPNPDGHTLFENVFSWNKLGNVLFIESPRTVGFSYQNLEVNKNITMDDTTTKIDAYLAIVDFFNVFPELMKNDLYIVGESYGGVYVPTLVAYMISQIQKPGGVKLNLKGTAIGNGDLSVLQNVRTLSSYMYFHGIYGEETWNKLQTMCCPSTNNEPTTGCPFDKYISVDKYGDINPIENYNNTVHDCGEMLTDLVQNNVWGSMNYVYNIYQDCYQRTRPILDLAEIEKHRQQLVELLVSQQKSKIRPNIKLAYMQAMPWFINKYSTDALGGFSCYMTWGATEYLSQMHVRKALHIPDYVPQWSFCNDNIDYVKQYNDTTQFFQFMLDSNYPLRVLIYNGDVDTACGIFEAEWFIENFANINKMDQSSHDTWLYQLTPEFAPQVGGYHKSFSKANMSIELLTVKGAGHMVPTDRAGPALQMLTNFVRQTSYNESSPFNFTRQPLLKEFEPLPTEEKLGTTFSPDSTTTGATIVVTSTTTSTTPPETPSSISSTSTTTSNAPSITSSTTTSTTTTTSTAPTTTTTSIPPTTTTTSTPPTTTTSTAPTTTTTSTPPTTTTTSTAPTTTTTSTPPTTTTTSTTSTTSTTVITATPSTLSTSESSTTQSLIHSQATSTKHETSTKKSSSIQVSVLMLTILTTVSLRHLA